MMTRREFVRSAGVVATSAAGVIQAACSGKGGPGDEQAGQPLPRFSFGNAFPGSLTSSPQIINVSHYDPKEAQRSGETYTESDVSALRRNGALGLIPRVGKGRTTDTKCASFLRAADREGMLLGAYYFILKGVDPGWQADRFVDRIKEIKRSGGSWRATKILMVVDIDSASTMREILRAIDVVERRTGKVPMVYMENSLDLMKRVRSASEADKRRLARSPYWLALYGHTASGREDPQGMLDHYRVWKKPFMWQYGGVEWNRSRGRSIAKHYNHGRWRSPQYFGNMRQPMERNAFNGSRQELYAFWDRYAWEW
ncbi:MAG: GH25 family lysozyme [Verrucomicrobiota bacterium]